MYRGKAASGLDGQFHMIFDFMFGRGSHFLHDFCFLDRDLFHDASADAVPQQGGFPAMRDFFEAFVHQ